MITDQPNEIRPRDPELLMLAGLALVIVLLGVASLGDLSGRLLSYGDTQAYLAIADGLRSGTLSRIVEGHFAGLPIAMAVFGTLFRVSSLSALLVVSWGASLGAVLVARRLCGAGAAAAFAVVSAEWLGRSALGGPEPLFVLLVLGGLLALRRERPVLASALIAYATTVRPVGIFALVALALDLGLRRRWRTLAVAGVVAAVFGALYLALMRQGGDPLANLHSYSADWRTRSPLSWPFVALYRGYEEHAVLATHDVKVVAWLVLAAVAAVVTLQRADARERARRHLAESAFAAMYLLFLVSYDSPWSWIELPRFMLPVAPLLLGAVVPSSARVRIAAWALLLPSAVFAAMTVIGVRESIEVMRRLW